jgi:hypothetical protein
MSRKWDREKSFPWREEEFVRLGNFRLTYTIDHDGVIRIRLPGCHNVRWGAVDSVSDWGSYRLPMKLRTTNNSTPLNQDSSLPLDVSQLVPLYR